VHHIIGLSFSLPAALAILLLAGAPVLAAQDKDVPASDSTVQDSSQPLIPRGSKVAVGASVDRFLYEGEGITAVSFRYSGLKPKTVATEVGVSFFPDALDAEALLFAPDVGAAYDFSGKGVDLLLKAGLSALTALGNGFAFEPGYHFGGGVLLRTGKASGIRLDVIRHTYLIDQEAEGIWSVGLGFTSLPRKTR